ncbi:unnamed protein product [Brugia pahangi]|uniref:V-SNARE coiled-coil homology domain-containing protein n=1 Tax=Brugia pahangi TaxID=6280 RepID=A0A0N4TZK0_BRUPA|nr:unnamed protein product [Brugia pahangi]
MESFSLPVTYIGRVTTLDSNRVQKIQRELEEVIKIVRSDIDRIIERESRLKNLTVRADEMEARAGQFSRKAIQVRRNIWWRGAHEMEARAGQFSRKAIQVRRNIWWRGARLTITIVCTCMLFVVGIIG